MTSSEQQQQMDPKPWWGVVPERDVAAFHRGAEEDRRPVRAGGRPAVVVVDVTEVFVSGPYSMNDPDAAAAVVAANAELLAAARRVGAPVFYTKWWAGTGHVPAPVELGVGKGATRRVLDPRAFSDGDDVVAELAPQPGDVVIGKGFKPSAFFGTPLSSYLTAAGVDTVVVTGISTSGCVRATVLDAFQHNHHVVVPHECVGDRSAISHAVSLFDLHMKYADVVSLAETVRWLGTVTPRVPGAGAEVRA